MTNSIENGIIAWYNIDMKTRIYMTKMHQQWTYGEREDLLPYLDGEDDEIFEYFFVFTQTNDDLQGYGSRLEVVLP